MWRPVEEAVSSTTTHHAPQLFTLEYFQRLKKQTYKPSNLIHWPPPNFLNIYIHKNLQKNLCCFITDSNHQRGEKVQQAFCAVSGLHRAVLSERSPSDIHLSTDWGMTHTGTRSRGNGETSQNYTNAQWNSSQTKKAGQPGASPAVCVMAAVMYW